MKCGNSERMNGKGEIRCWEEEAGCSRVLDGDVKECTVNDGFFIIE